VAPTLGDLEQTEVQDRSKTETQEVATASFDHRCRACRSAGCLYNRHGRASWGAAQVAAANVENGVVENGTSARIYNYRVSIRRHREARTHEGCHRIPYECLLHNRSSS